MKAPCRANDCDRASRTRGLCGKHYNRLLQHGDPNKVTRAAAGEPMRWLEAELTQLSDECLIWPYATTGRGYGAVRFQGRQTPAHRASLWLHAGPPPEGDYHAAHDPEKCNNPRCVNPRHLRWATPAENNLDKGVAGTQIRGRQINTNRHSEAEVLAIFHAAGTLHEIAEKHDATPTTVHNIRSGLSWSWLTQRSQQATDRIIESEDPA